MAKTNIDFKELGIKYGEKAGFGFAAFLMVLLVIWGITSSSAVLTADTIKRNAKEADNQIEASRVVESKLVPPEVVTPERLRELAFNVKHFIPLRAFEFQFPFFMHFSNEDYRRNPEAKVVSKLAAAPIEIGFRRYYIQPPNAAIVEKQGKKVTVKMSEQQKKDRENQKKSGSKGGGAGMPPGMGGMGGMGGLGGGGKGGNRGGLGMPGFGGDMPGGGGQQTEETIYRPVWMPIDKLNDELLANDLWVARAVLIEGSFPHGEQMDEIAKAIKADKSNLEVFYKRLEVQRRLILPRGEKLRDGKVLTEDHVWFPTERTMKPLKALPDSQVDEKAAEAGWMKVDLEPLFPYLRYTVEWEEETNPIKQHLIDVGVKLAMSLPKLVHGNYPDLFKELPDLQATVDKFEQEGKNKLPPAKKHKDLERSEDFDPFGGGGTRKDDAPGAGTGNPPKGSGDQGKDKVDYLMPDFCTVRFLDLTLDLKEAPGKTYEYRVRIVLRNPNYKQVELVAVPDFAKLEEIPGPWSAPVRVTMPDEAYVYAEERPSKSIAPRDYDLKDRVPVQVHKWLGNVHRHTGALERVGEWWVDHILAGRGEFIGRNMNSATVLAPSPTAPPAKKEESGYSYKEEKKAAPPPPAQLPPILNPLTSGESTLIFWSAATPEDDKHVGADMLVQRAKTEDLLTGHLLVDFEGGRTEAHKFGTRRWEEEVPTEILVIEPDGRLVAHTLLKDKDDSTRKTRMSTFEKWFKEVQSRSAGSGKSTKNTGGLFDK